MFNFIPKLSNLILLLILLIVSSCATLTKTQIEAINQFAVTTNNFSDYPSKVLTSMADIRYERGLLFASTLSPEGNVEELTDLFIALKEDYKVAVKADISFKVMDKYIEALLLLSSDEHASNMETHAHTFGENLDSLINTYNTIEDVNKVPTKLGNAVGKILITGGKQYIRIKQAKYLKEYITRADTLIGIMTDNLITFLKKENIKELLENEERGIKSDYKSFVRHRKPTPDLYRTKYNILYLDLLSDLYETEILVNKTIRSTENLRKAHKKLKENITKRKKLKENITEIQSLFANIQDIKKSIDIIHQHSDDRSQSSEDNNQ